MCTSVSIPRDPWSELMVALTSHQWPRVSYLCLGPVRALPVSMVKMSLLWCPCLVVTTAAFTVVTLHLNRQLYYCIFQLKFNMKLGHLNATIGNFTQVNSNNLTAISEPFIEYNEEMRRHAESIMNNLELILVFVFIVVLYCFASSILSMVKIACELCKCLTCGFCGCNKNCCPRWLLIGSSVNFFPPFVSCLTVAAINKWWWNCQ